MAAILVILPGPFEQTFVPPFYRVSIWNLSSIGPVVSEEKMFEIVDWRMTEDGRHDPLAQVEVKTGYKIMK